MNATLSENFTLVCSASGYPVPTIIWTHNGTLVNKDENDRATIILELMGLRSVMSTLAVSMAAINDSGDYACIVNSSIDNFQNITAGPVTVLVQGETRTLVLLTLIRPGLLLTYPYQHQCGNNIIILVTYE